MININIIMIHSYW